MQNVPDDQNEPRLYDIREADPAQKLIDRSSVSPETLEEISRLMTALADLRAAERILSEASQRYMRLNETDMRALHYLILCQHQQRIATPGSIAKHLGISTASTTKLLDRLEAGGHVTRHDHPSDRRALSIRITPGTHASAMSTVGKQQAQRFNAALELSSQERQTVIGFLESMTRHLALDPELWQEHPPAAAG